MVNKKYKNKRSIKDTSAFYTVLLIGAAFIVLMTVVVILDSTNKQSNVGSENMCKDDSDCLIGFCDGGYCIVNDYEGGVMLSAPASGSAGASGSGGKYCLYWNVRFYEGESVSECTGDSGTKTKTCTNGVWSDWRVTYCPSDSTCIKDNKGKAVCSCSKEGDTTSTSCINNQNLKGLFCKEVNGFLQWVSFTEDCQKACDSVMGRCQVRNGVSQCVADGLFGSGSGIGKICNFVSKIFN